MIQRSSIVIDKSKSQEFIAFLKKNAKDSKFWEANKSVASTQINKAEIDALFDAKK